MGILSCYLKEYLLYVILNRFKEPSLNHIIVGIVSSTNCGHVSETARLSDRIAGVFLGKRLVSNPPYLTPSGNRGFRGPCQVTLLFFSSGLQLFVFGLIFLLTSSFLENFLVNAGTSEVMTSPFLPIPLFDGK